jgi:endonuclease G
MSSKRSFISLLAALMLGGCLQLNDPGAPTLVSFSPPASLRPEGPIVLDRLGFALAYDGRLRGAGWVYEELTASSIENHADRSEFDFMEDPLIPSHLRATKQDFAGSGYDRGHLRPAANARSNAELMKETFYFSNISPQNPQLNRKYWLKLEKHVRDLTKSFDVVYVITGPLFLPKKMEDGKRYVVYEVIGKNDVAVPTHFFKVLQAKKGRSIKTEAYIIPNEPIGNDRPLQSFATTLEKVEKAAGLCLTR